MLEDIAWRIVEELLEYGGIGILAIAAMWSAVCCLRRQDAREVRLIEALNDSTKAMAIVLERLAIILERNR